MVPFVLRKTEFNILNKKLLATYEQTSRFLPSCYYDLRIQNYLSEQFCEKYVCIIGILVSIEEKEGKIPYVSAKLRDSVTGRSMTILWFGCPWIYRKHKYGVKKQFLVYGKLSYNEQFYSYSIINPVVFSEDVQDERKLLPKYKKIPGVSYATLNKLITESSYYHINDYIPSRILQQAKLPNINDAVKYLHFPQKEEDIKLAVKRLIFDDMLYFAVRMNQKQALQSDNLPIIETHDIQDKVIADLPYHLTADQEKTVRELTRYLLMNNPINALVQGDVGCGKTIVAFLMMFVMAENGYQSVLMAPTEVLATQHYKQLSEMTEKYGYKTAFLNGSLKKREKEKLLKGIADGEYLFIVGTHSVGAEGVDYSNLGMILVDEEHKFGVKLKESLQGKASCNAPYISLTATPIPRTLAELVYGINKQIYEIKTLPDGRQNADTYCDSQYHVPAIVDEELKNGRQVYVVCPQIETSEEDEDGKEKQIERHSIEEVKMMYEHHFAGNPDVKIGVLSGKSSKATKTTDENVLQDFMDNKVQILIATTVIEVGVNNPNASVIVIQDADFYGLSTMHQLRGRVKRGSYKPYCVLVSPIGLDNPRLKILCETEDGFKIAEEDFKLRKAGNILGTEQSGENKYIELIEFYPNLYQKTLSIARDMIAHGEEKEFLDFMDSIKFPYEEPEQ